jgi:hypothetical protein
MDETLSKATPVFWARLAMIGRLLVQFKHAVHITSTRDCPGSAFPLLVMALRSCVLAVLDLPDFDITLGDGAAADSRDVLAPRWNMSGAKPPGRKVGFLDKHHIWMLLLDPFTRRLNLDWDEWLGVGGRAAAVTDLLKWAYPDPPPEDAAGDAGLAVAASRAAFRQNFDAFCSATGPFTSAFDVTTPMPAGHALTISDVSDWIRSTGAHEQRLAWYESNARRAVIYTDAAKQLLSVSITGSMDVERAAKPLKNSVLVKDRASMSVGMADIALRAGVNLQFLQAAKEKLVQAQGGV